MVLYLVDAHNDYQSGLNIEQVAREDFSGLIVKATQGATGYTAPSAFDSWISRARNADMIPGAYHWLTSASASKQVDHFLKRLDAVGGPEGLLCAVDVEDTSNPPSEGIARAFCDQFEQRTGGHPLLLYTGAWWWKPRGWDGESMTPYLWASRYVSGSGLASALYGKMPASWWVPGYGGWSRATMVQFSSSGKVAGKAVDVNAFPGDLNDLRALTTNDRSIMEWSDGLDVSRYRDELTDLDSDDMSAETLITGIYGNLRILARDAETAFNAEQARDGNLVTMLEGIRNAVLAVGTPQVSDEQIDQMVVAIRQGLADEIASAVLSQLEPSTRQIAQVAQRLDGLATALGGAGDLIGSLNDTPAA
jgi:GH25 family lysozyme M1 (1,4-beta-N-acetylmuramidase)